MQELEAEGYETKVISVDRVKDRQCIPYEFLRNVLYEQRVIMYKTQLLRDELVGLQKDNTTGKVDHIKNASKDQADAFCGSLYHASLHAEEYAFEYGESIDTMIDISLGRDDMLDSLLAPIDYEAYKPQALTYDSGYDNRDYMMSQGILLF